MSKIEAFWENATADDVARMMKGETVEARFWDHEHRGKVLGLLVGWSRSEPCWCCEHCKQTGGRSYFENCQVYREPSWYADKPDPGEGWRMLHPDERVEKGDEYYSSLNNMWLLSGNPDTYDCKQGNFPYRRRIEPEPKHYVLRVGDTIETPTGRKIKITSRTETQEVYALMPGNRVALPNGQTIKVTEKGFEVTQ